MDEYNELKQWIKNLDTSTRQSAHDATDIPRVAQAKHTGSARRRIVSKPSKRTVTDTTAITSHSATSSIAELHAFVRNVFSDHGLKYTVDAKLTSLMDAIKVDYAQHTDTLNDEVTKARSEIVALRSQMADIIEEHKEEVRELRRNEADRIRKLKVIHTRDLNKRVRALVAVTEEKLNETFNERVQTEVDARIETIHAELAARELTEREQQLSECLKATEEKASEVLTTKTEELNAMQKQMNELRDEVEAAREVLGTTLPKLREMEAENQALHSENARVSELHDAIESRMELMSKDHATVVEQLQSQHTNTIDVLQQRVQSVVAKKDTVISGLKERLQDVQKRNAELNAVITTGQQQLVNAESED